MTDRIDHASRSRRRMEQTLSSYETGEDAGAIVVALAALNDATLALVEQQRIANLVALASLAGRDEDVHEEVSAAAYGALNALISYQDVPNGHAGPDEVAVLRPDIAAALGIEAVDHE